MPATRPEQNDYRSPSAADDLSGRLAGIAHTGGHRTLAERAFASLHEAIVTGVLQPGERLPIEELATVLDMSPMPIREALRRLDAAGMVENVPHRGARVTELSIDDLREVYQARLALEPLAIRQAAMRFTDADAKTASDALQRHRTAVRHNDVVAAWRAHTDFHFALYDAAGSRWLIRLVTPLWETSERYRHASSPIAWRLDARQREHDRILEACIAHDPERAAAELHNHLVGTAEHVSSDMGGPQLFELRPVPPAGNGRDVGS
ncbi:MAG: GntR family transcriptional regulator [Solirubrobacteraceae bacterium]|nr:GntR family transcriptional regulator [Solirubrobacteraceae bacterium]